jgi:hypothetical protein
MLALEEQILEQAMSQSVLGHGIALMAQVLKMFSLVRILVEEHGLVVEVMVILL